MSKNMKIVLIVLGCIVLLCSGVIGVGIYWFSTSGKQMMEQMSQGIEKAVDDGSAFGRDKEDTACLKEALIRIQKDSSMPNTMAVNMFLAGCLGKSKHTPSFCAGAPARGEFTKTSEWATQRCKELGTPTQACGQLMGVVQAHCNSRNAASEPK